MFDASMRGRLEPRRLTGLFGRKSSMLLASAGLAQPTVPTSDRWLSPSGKIPGLAAGLRADSSSNDHRRSDLRCRFAIAPDASLESRAMRSRTR
jgi:hypothetical protein